MNWMLNQPVQALCLTGGGYRGLFTARALQVIEEHIGVPIGQRFDLTCGTTIGGIVTLAVAFEVPMSRVTVSDVQHVVRNLARPAYTKLRSFVRRRR